MSSGNVAANEKISWLSCLSLTMVSTEAPYHHCLRSRPLEGLLAISHKSTLPPASPGATAMYCCTLELSSFSSGGGVVVGEICWAHKVEEPVAIGRRQRTPLPTNRTSCPNLSLSGNLQALF